MLPSIKESDRYHPSVVRLYYLGVPIGWALFFLGMDYLLYLDRKYSVKLLFATLWFPLSSLCVACSGDAVKYKGNVRVVQEASCTRGYLGGRTTDGDNGSNDRVVCPRCGGWTGIECYDLYNADTRLMPGVQWDPWLPRLHCRACGAIGKRQRLPRGRFRWEEMTDAEETNEASVNSTAARIMSTKRTRLRAGGC